MTYEFCNEHGQWETKIRFLMKINIFRVNSVGIWDQICWQIYCKCPSSLMIFLQTLWLYHLEWIRQFSTEETDSQILTSELKAGIISAWRAYPQEHVVNAIDSFRERCRIIISMREDILNIYNEFINKFDLIYQPNWLKI